MVTGRLVGPNLKVQGRHAPNVSVRRGRRAADQCAEMVIAHGLRDDARQVKRVSTERWNDVPRGTMDEVSSHIRLDLRHFDGKAAH
jgi:hypothetical protein